VRNLLAEMGSLTSHLGAELKTLVLGCNEAVFSDRSYSIYNLMCNLNTILGISEREFNPHPKTFEVVKRLSPKIVF
jgi:hypothetical protein